MFGAASPTDVAGRRTTGERHLKGPAVPSVWAVRVVVVRHGCAGRKDDWQGPDDERPLDAAGEEQARALADAIADLEVRRLLSSPARRCVDTLEPLASKLGLEIERTDQLTSEAAPGALVELLAAPTSAGAVLCTHGEAMTPILEWLTSHGCRPGPGSDDQLLAKGTAWLVDLDGDRPVTSHHVAPSLVVNCPQHPPLDTR